MLNKTQKQSRGSYGVESFLIKESTDTNLAACTFSGKILSMSKKRSLGGTIQEICPRMTLIVEAKGGTMQHMEIGLIHYI